MSLLTKSVPIVTDSSGDDVSTVRLGPCVIRMIRFEIGTLDNPDLTITEQPGGKVLLDVTGVADDLDYMPAVKLDDRETGDNVAAGPIPDGNGGVTVNAWAPVAVLDRIQVVVANGGDTLTGRLVFLYEH